MRQRGFGHQLAHAEIEDLPDGLAAGLLGPEDIARLDIPMDDGGGASGVEPLADVAAPVDLPLSYSGTVAGVEVEVRGGPVAVSEMKGARILLINAEGLWIRIRVPAGTGRRDAPDAASR